MISNGFDITKVYDALKERIGWNQPTVAGSPTLSDANKASTSGRFYDEGHAVVRANIVYDVQENESITADQFNQLLQNMNKGCIMQCLNAVFNRPQLIETGLVYERSSNIRNVVIPNQGNFCGYRIKVAEGNYAVQINTISLFFNAAATFNIYLFNDLVKDPLKTKSVTTVANSQVVVDLEWILNYIGTQNKGGMFYIGYFQDDLGSANGIDEQLNQWAPTKVYGAWPFQSPKTGTLDFNRINPSVVFRSYGLNLQISAYRDYTQTIIQNAHLFDEARILLMASKIIELIKNSIRSNKTERISAENIAQLEYDLNLAFPTEERPFMAGIKAQLVREYKRINDNFFPKKEALSVPIGRSADGLAYQYDTFDIRNLPPREQNY